MGKEKNKMLLQYFLEKEGSETSKKLLKEIEKMGKVERNYLYLLVFSKDETEKAMALKQYMEKLEEVKETNNANFNRMSNIITQMNEVLEIVQENGNTEDLLNFAQ